jgi:hypothetical protein
MPRTVIKRVKVTGWHTDKDTGAEIARLKITFEGQNGARVSGKMHAYLSRAQMDAWGQRSLRKGAARDHARRPARRVV